MTAVASTEWAPAGVASATCTPPPGPGSIDVISPWNGKYHCSRRPRAIWRCHPLRRGVFVPLNTLYSSARSVPSSLRTRALSCPPHTDFG